MLSKIIIEGCSVGANTWLAQWSGIANSTESIRNQYLGIYGAFGAGKVLTSLFSSLLLAYATVHSGRILHTSMLINVFKSPMSFFETNPSGRIINRFSTDIFIIDEVILWSWIIALPFHVLLLVSLGLFAFQHRYF